MVVPAGRLATWDYVTMGLLVALSSSVGLYHVFAAMKSKNSRDFLVTSRDLGLLPLILSTVGTSISAVGMLGFPMETYTNGACFMTLCFAFFFVAILGTCLFLPVFYELGTNSIFEYLELRFGSRGLRQCASLLSNLNLLMYTACVIYAPALALNQVTGLHLWASVISIAIICIIYTSMGGIKAVVWADAAQIVVMLLVLLTIIFKGLSDVGGFGKVFQTTREGRRGDVFLFSSSPYSTYTIWTLVVGGTFHQTIVATSQMQMQRYLSNGTFEKAKRSFIGGCVGVTIMTLLNTFGGLVIYTKYHGCDPLLQGKVTSRDQLMALFAVETLSFQEGMPGIFVAAILCATLSTLSSSLNSMSAMTMEDYIRPWKPNMSDQTAMKVSKVLGVVYGLACIGLVAVAESLGGLIKAIISIFGVTGGPVLSLFTMGMLFPWINKKGAMVGVFCSVALPLWACVGNLATSPASNMAPMTLAGCNANSTYLTPEGAASNVTSFMDLWDASNIGASTPQREEPFILYAVHSLWYSCWSILIGSATALLVSFITGHERHVDPKLLFPFVRKWVSDGESKKKPIAPSSAIYFPLANGNKGEATNGGMAHAQDTPLHDSPAGDDDEDGACAKEEDQGKALPLS